MAELATCSDNFGAAILDDDCKFKALSNGFRSVIGCFDNSVCEPNAIFEHVPGLIDWVNAAISMRQENRFQGGSFTLEFLPLEISNNASPDSNFPGIYFLIARSSVTPPSGLNTERVRRIQHDIKNQLGGVEAIHQLSQETTG